MDIAGSTLPISDAIKLLGITFDRHLNYDKHISEIVRSCNYHLCAIRHIRHMITRNVAAALCRCLILSRLDYFNSLLYGASNASFFHSLSNVSLASNFRSNHLQNCSLSFKTLLLKSPTYLYDISRHEHTRSLRSSSTGFLNIPVAGSAWLAAVFVMQLVCLECVTS
ncbi:hypothetical protein HELRODRAFT_174296 [Helobdella robusta]|uniref:Uncharacterized protein n=1 Tax=Helobdella robusta TaxID=6412 RepID=T1F7Y4_HELRO|nr:hypothetical protein HELRODRAFT_174296 [Helobdella robusta]ESO02859.1 hypothetical protein HELRODRAFT_174296 [Helobdella robusta]